MDGLFKSVFAKTKTKDEAQPKGSMYQALTLKKITPTPNKGYFGAIPDLKNKLTATGNK